MGEWGGLVCRAWLLGAEPRPLDLGARPPASALWKHARGAGPLHRAHDTLAGPDFHLPTRPHARSRHEAPPALRDWLSSDPHRHRCPNGTDLVAARGWLDVGGLARPLLLVS